MVVTRGGVTGVGVACGAEEELSNALVYATGPGQQTEEEIVVDWDQL